MFDVCLKFQQQCKQKDVSISQFHIFYMRREPHPYRKGLPQTGRRRWINAGSADDKLTLYYIHVFGSFCSCPKILKFRLDIHYF